MGCLENTELPLKYQLQLQETFELLLLILAGTPESFLQ
jgi:hypothetical protein